MKTTTFRLVVDTKLWKRFKSQCALEGIPMFEKIIQLIRKYLGE